MKRGRRVLLLTLIAGVGALVAAGWGQGPPAAVTDTKQKAKECYDAVVSAYMGSKWAALTEAQKEAVKYLRLLTPQQADDLKYIRKAAAECRPKWWAACKSTTKTGFGATLWNRTFATTFVPAEKPSTDVNYRTKLLKVSWDPTSLDSTAPADGAMGTTYYLTKGDLAEVNVWRQLGLGYLYMALPASTIDQLLQNDKFLLEHFQEFYANVAALYHCSPGARRAGMLQHYVVMSGNAREPTKRAYRIVAALFLAEVLADPSKWPSVELPLEVPEKDVERSAAAFLCNNIDPNWTLVEDRALRTALQKFVQANGEQMLRSRGRAVLPNRLPFMLMALDDKACQVQRDAWAKRMLAKALGS